LYLKNGQKAIDSFQEQIRSIVFQLVKEYSEFRDLMEEEKSFKTKDSFSTDLSLSKNSSDEIQVT
jgi:hypothetical protein